MSLHERLTRARAIRAKCLDCMGGQAAEVRRCTSHGCALFRYRLGSEERSLDYIEPRYHAPKHLPVMLEDGTIVEAKDRTD